MSRAGGHSLNGYRLAALALIVAGVLALGWGNVRVTDQTDTLALGSVELTVREHRSVNVSVWAGVVAIVAGVLVLTSAGRTVRA